MTCSGLCLFRFIENPPCPFQGLLNELKVVSYALIHDLPEAYAGDVDPYYSSHDETKAKEDNEKEAVARLKREFDKTFPDLCKLIGDYEANKRQVNGPDKEASSVYSLDKLLVCLNIYMLNDPYYTVLEYKKVVSMQKDMERQLAKASFSPEIVALFQQLMPIAFKEKPQTEGLGL